MKGNRTQAHQFKPAMQPQLNVDYPFESQAIIAHTP